MLVEVSQIVDGRRQKPVVIAGDDRHQDRRRFLTDEPGRQQGRNEPFGLQNGAGRAQHTMATALPFFFDAIGHSLDRWAFSMNLIGQRSKKPHDYIGVRSGRVNWS